MNWETVIVAVLGASTTLATLLVTQRQARREAADRREAREAEARARAEEMEMKRTLATDEARRSENAAERERLALLADAKAREREEYRRQSRDLIRQAQQFSLTAAVVANSERGADVSYEVSNARQLATSAIAATATLIAATNNPHVIDAAREVGRRVADLSSDLRERAVRDVLDVAISDLALLLSEIEPL